MKDRELGDEWKEWQGSQEDIEKTESSQLVFWTLSVVSVIFFSAFILLAEYLIVPRLAGFHPRLPLILRTLVITSITIMITWIFLVGLSILVGFNFTFGISEKIFSMVNMIPHASKIGERFNINRDRISNSFIKFHNSLVKLKRKPISPCDMLVLLPRCLKPEVLKNVLKTAGKYNIKAFVLAGGEAAREKVMKFRPKAIVAIACERDLVSGMRDVASRVLVLGVPNKRPEGPCRNTCTDVKEFENSLRFFLGKPAI